MSVGFSNNWWLMTCCESSFNEGVSAQVRLLGLKYGSGGRKVDGTLKSLAVRKGRRMAQPEHRKSCYIAVVLMGRYSGENFVIVSYY